MTRSRPIRRLVGILMSAAALLAVTAATSTEAQAKTAKPPAADPTLTESYDAAGSSHIGSINAVLPISKTKLIATLDLNNFKILSGTLPIKPQVVPFTALGFIPLRATVTLVQTAPITGALTPTAKGNKLAVTVSYEIKLSNIEVSAFGQWISLGVGNDCQSVNPSVISVGSPTGKYFDVGRGGPVTGTYAIGQFQNCAPLSLPDLFGIGSLPVNALVPGTNNTLSLTIKNGKFVSST